LPVRRREVEGGVGGGGSARGDMRGVFSRGGEWGERRERVTGGGLSGRGGTQSEAAPIANPTRGGGMVAGGWA